MSGGQEVEELLGSIDFTGIDEAISGVEGLSKISFGDLVWKLLTGQGQPTEELGRWIWNILAGEWEANKTYLVYILLLAVAFSLLKNFALVFEKSYVSNVCFLLVYGLLMVLLMKSVLILNGVVGEAIGVVIDFMTAFIPVFATTVVVSRGSATAMGFYELGFLVVYVVQWVLSCGMIPMIRMYVVMGLLNYVVEEGRFSKLTDLLENIISWALKLLTSIVLGINIIKNAIAPVGDTFARQTLRKSLAFVPGIGSTLTAVSDMFLAAGDVIRGGIGATALVVLIAIVVVPMTKVGVMVIFYRVLAVFVEPVADKRISNAILIASKGGSMLFRILSTCVILVFLTVAMTTLLGGMR
ncbi:MAG: stage III sporulation protein AE [Lachnospiraceae bacterium]|nr:stage III sporulation protein AE [Lachnospiraceae bacterium]